MFLGLQYFVELWGEASSWEELETAIQRYSHSRKSQWTPAHLSWRIRVEAWGQAISLEEQVKLVNRLQYVDPQVKTPSTRMLMFQAYLPAMHS